ncbi:MAG: DUF87 domain-containing protein [Marinifilaceae bacterium]|jgi:DNA helicase HerA-like ATPase|nr:DUF87 domain-containing protein [Marinifilaceae bacterium]
MKIGKIVAVEFDKFRVKLLDASKNSTISIAGQVYFFGNIGSYLKAENINGDFIICEVISIMDNSLEDAKNNKFNIEHSRELYIKPIGTLNKYMNFSIGVGIFPSIFSDVSIVTKNDLDAILKTDETKARTSPEIHKHFYVGKSKNLIDYSVKINIDHFFNIHTAVLGNSGSGKSNTIAHILQEVLRKNDYWAIGAKIILFDVNGEYKKAFEKDIDSQNIDIKFYKPNSIEDDEKFILPYYLMNLDEWCAFLLASDRTQKPFWDRVLQECYRFYKISEKDSEDEYINYLKWKLRNILRNISSKVDSDTSKMTAAKGAIAHIKDTYINLLKSTKNNSSKDFISFLNVCDKLCFVNFGDNKDSLIDAIPKFNYIETQLNVSINAVRDRGNITAYKTETSETATQNSFKQINEKQALVTNSKKLLQGNYFDYNFLETAVDIVLLEEEAKGNTRIREFTSTMLSRLDYFLYNSDCEFMRTITEDNIVNSENDFLKNILGIGNTKTKQLIVIDSSEISKDILELMTSVSSRMLFDYRKKLQGDKRKQKPIHLILDEAHRYIHKNTDYILNDNIFEKIAREGRKYSLFLIVSSQRPSELSDTVLSQCGNYIIHRIQNEIDMKYIYSVLPYFSPEYIHKIKQSTPGEALIFGNCVPMPLQVKVQKANPEPNSGNSKISNEWYIEQIIEDTTEK